MVICGAPGGGGGGAGAAGGAGDDVEGVEDAGAFEGELPADDESAAGVFAAGVSDVVDVVEGAGGVVDAAADGASDEEETVEVEADNDEAEDDVPAPWGAAGAGPGAVFVRFTSAVRSGTAGATISGAGVTGASVGARTWVAASAGGRAMVRAPGVAPSS